jgi:hypothetical protein
MHCWGKVILKDADEATKSKDVGVDNIWKGLATVKTQNDGSITAAFERQGKGQHTYSTCPHTYIGIQ